MFKPMLTAFAAAAVTAGGAMTQAASAQEVKVGLVLPYTGIGAELAQQIERGMELYLKLNADAVKPYKITFIKRDSKAPRSQQRSGVPIRCRLPPACGRSRRTPF